MVSGTKGTTTLSLIYLAPIQHTIHTIHIYIYAIESCAWLTFFMLLCGRVDIQEGQEEGGGRDKAQDMEMKMEKFAC